MPPIKIYDNNQEQQSLLLKDKEMIKLPNNDDTPDDEEKVHKDITLNETSSKSPQKSLAITKGPQRVIP